MFNLLSKREKTTIIWLLFLVFLAFLFYVLVGAKQKRTYVRSMDLLEVKRRQLQEAQKEQKEKQDSWLRWQQTHVDMEELRADYFYSDDQGLELRRDLQKIFDKTGVRVMGLGYEYTDFEGEQIKRAQVSFDIAVNYFTLKRFIHAVETFPKFLLVEKIDFLDINPQGGFKIRLTLAAYYES